MGFIGGLLAKRRLKGKSKAVPFHFEIHGDQYSLDVESLIEQGAVFDLFFKGVKKMRKKASISEGDKLPDSFSANPQQLKALSKVVINKRFLEDVSKQVRKDVPTFKIIDEKLVSLTWEAQGIDQYKQNITISGVCYYEE
jgi:hypothetical protein